MAETTVKQRAFAFIASHFQSIGLSRFVYVDAFFSAVTTCQGFHLTVIALGRFHKRSTRDRLRYDPVILISRSHSTNADHNRLM